ncbi:hypothetical protein HDE_04644 [Halotydeus destructor]|nr:hypothetical protein HDE_04644 [Halotydeus destructor]
MDMKQVYQVVDYLILCYGLRLTPCNGYQRKLSFIITLVIYICYAFDFIVHVVQVGKPFAYARDMSVIIFPFMSFLWLAFRLSKIQKLWTDINILLTEKDKLIIRNFTFAIVIVYTLNAIMMISLDVFSYYVYDKWQDWLPEFIPWKVESVQFHHKAFIVFQCTFFYALHSKQWVIVMMGIYCITLVAWSLADRSLVTMATRIGQLDASAIKELASRKHQIIELGIEFNSLFSIIPLLLFMSAFIESTELLLTLLGKSRCDLYEVLRFFINLFVMLLGVTIMSKVQNDRSAQNEAFLRDSSFKMSAIDGDYIKYRLSIAFSTFIQLDAILFRLSQSVVLEFASSLLTFTVMFYQLDSSN